MANQLQVIDLNSTALALPAHLQNMPDVVGKITQGDTRNRISLKGREFHIIRGGIEEGVLNTKHMDAIIVGAHRFIGRQYYNTPYEDGVAITPACFSKDGNTPDPGSKELQAERCSECPQNVKGSAINGGEKSKACGFVRPTAVILAGDPEFIIYQLDLKAMSIWNDGMPAQGKFSFAEYAKKLSAHHIDAGKVITRFTFTNDSVPALQFQAIGYIEAEQVTRIVELVESGAVQDVIDNAMGTALAPAALPVPVAAPKIAQKAPVTAPTPAPKPVIKPQAATPVPVPVPRPVARPSVPAKPQTTRPVVVQQVAMPAEETEDEVAASHPAMQPVTIKYGQVRKPSAPLNTIRATPQQIEQDADALIAELDSN